MTKVRVRLLTTICLVVLVLSPLLGLQNNSATASSAGLADTSWPMFRHDLQHTGRSPYNGPSSPILKWSYTTGGAVYSSPAIGSDGIIYVGSQDNKLYAINPDGSLKWSYITGNMINSSPAISSDGTIYIGSYDNKLYAINPDGSLKWSYTTGSYIQSSPAIGTDGTIYVGSDDSKLYALNPDGSLKWNYITGTHIASSPAVGTDGTIYVGSGYEDKKLYALNSDGTLKWSFTTGGGVDSSPAIASDGTVYVGCTDSNELYALNPDGSLKWTYTTTESISSSAVGSDGTVYASTGYYDKKLYALNPDGSLKWTFATGGVESSSPAIDSNGTIYIGSYDKKLYALNPDGSLEWTYTAEGRLQQSSPVIGSDGTIYVGSEDNNLYAIGSANQSPIQPGNSSPSNGAVGISLTPALQSSAFSDPDTGDTHTASQWQITTTAGNYSSTVFDSGTDTSNLTSINIPSGIINYLTTCYWHVRHRDNGGAWSAWSAETSLTTLANPADTTPPVISSIATSGITPTSALITWTTSELATDNVAYGLTSGYVSYAPSPADTTANKTSHSVTLSGLSPNTTYHYQVKSEDYSNNESVSIDNTFTTPESYLADTPWPMFGHDPQHTGRSPYTGPELPVEKWSFSTGGSIESSPAIAADGTIYIGSNDNNLYAINPNGSLKWTFNIGASVKSSPAIAADGTIYVGSSYPSNKLYAINPDGSQKWSFTTGSYIHSSPAISTDGTIYIGSGYDDKKLYAINPDGTKKWSFTTGAEITSSPAIATDGTIYVGSIDSKLYAINPDGTQKWSFNTGFSISSSPSISTDGTIYLIPGYPNNKLYAFNPDGSQKWIFTTGVGILISTAISAEGTIYVASTDSKLHAINPDGSQEWEFTTGAGIISSPIIDANGTIYIGSNDKKLHAINPDGTKKWSFIIGGNIYISPAINAEGTIYVGCENTNIYAIGHDDNNPPVQPSNVSPSNGATGDVLTITLQSSAFTDSDAGDTHAASQWQITTTAGNYSSTVFDSATDASNLTTTSIPVGTLNSSTTYYWHVKHQDNHGAWSPWSAETMFTTLADTTPPIISTIASSGIGKNYAVITWKTNEPATSNLEYGMTTGYGSTAPSPADTTNDHTSHIVSFNGLSPNTTYHYRIRAKDASNNESISMDYTFTTPAFDPLAHTPWPMFGHDSQHTGRSPYSGPELPAEKWNFTTGNDILSSPAIAVDNTIYVGSMDNKLYALNPNGSKKWSFTTGFSIRTSPVVAIDGTIYVYSGDNKLYAVNPDGTQKWSIPVGGGINYSSPAVATDGTIYVGSGNNLFAINPVGSQKWNFTTGDSVFSSPAIATDGTIYVGSNDKKLYAINPDGSQKWSFITGSAITSSPAIGTDGTIYVGSWNNLYAVNPDGSQKWIFAAVSYFGLSPAIATDGTIYIGSDDSNLYAINKDGTKKWSFATEKAITASPIISSDGTIFIGSFDGNLYAIDQDGTKKWSFAIYYYRNSLPAIGADGTIYVGSWDNKLYAIGEAPPQADFTASPLTSFAPLTVQFNDQSAGNITSWSWDFDNDGTTDSTDQNPSHTYTDLGIYTVSLTVTGPTGTNTEAKINYISVITKEAFNNYIQNQIQGQIIEWRGLSPTTEVDIQYMTRAELEEQLSGDPSEEDIQEIITQQEIFILLDMMEEGQDLYTLTLDLDSGTVIGFYSFMQKNITIVFDSEIMGTSEQMTFAHEYTHALQDQHFDLTTLRSQGEGNSDISMAILSLIEGDAETVQGTYYWLALDDAERAAYDNESNEYDTDWLEDIPDVLIQDMIFPYTAGVNFVYALGDAGGGWKAVNDAYNNLPQSTEQIIHPEKYLAGDEPQAITMPDLAGALGGTWSQMYTDVLGELYMIVYLNTYLEMDQAKIAAEGWDGDRLVYLKDADNNKVIAIKSVWDSAVDATEFFNTYVSFMEEKSGGTWDLLLEDEGIRQWHTAGSFVSLSQSGENVLITIAPNEATTRKVLTQFPEFHKIPQAGFSTSLAQITAGQTIAFTDTSAGFITEWEWDFDNDGTVDSTEQNPSHTYLIPGKYTISLKVTGAGGTDSEIKIEYITAYQVPHADFSVSLTQITMGQLITFNDISTGDITGREWDFNNDGTVDSTEQNPSHIYDISGKYTISLKITTLGGVDTEIKSEYITAYQLPEAGFSASLAQITAGQTIVFTDTSAGSITGWQWDFDNDGTVDNIDQNPSHIYDIPGKYTVSLKVTGPGGEDTEIKSDYITVVQQTTPDSSGAEDGDEGKGSGFLDCSCGDSGKEGTSTTALLTGWSMVGVIWGSGYYLVRRKGRRRK